ncbi:MAG: pyridoxamine 5'-phosphate oxidase family protein [Candidatus Omnitrophica bacterium]|nr:pyridoxamine 5'-phosphate oxidase family protein [Candidatus Omnitrophota bacterium]MCM8831695.1 pyridoxamine 5'-phosphate oxidase family protein [Candidatus Omnitrophota bacterium]
MDKGRDTLKNIPKKVIDFFKRQNFVIVSSLDKDGFIHNSCKGIVQVEGNFVYLLDLYEKNTYRNLQNRPIISITAVDDDKFEGYSLKGKATLIKKSVFGSRIANLWDENVTKRITQRVIKRIKGEKNYSGHPEASFPKPKYIIKMKVEKIVYLAPSKNKKGG